MSGKADHILIVEDEVRMAEILSDYLRQAGFETSHLATGIGVVDLIKTSPPNLVLLDLMLPGVDGIEICSSVRKFSAVPIIMVTAKAEEIDRLLGLEMGADDYICKPFSPREVVARVKAVLRRLKHDPAAESGSKLFDIDEEKGRITVRGQKLDLTPTEFRLLKLFVSRPGRVFSRAQLLDLCYQQEQFVFDRVIDSHVKNLRKKLSKVLDVDVIHAVYGVGYRYEV